MKRLERAVNITSAEKKSKMVEALVAQGSSLQEAVEYVNRPQELWMNDIYTVSVERRPDRTVHSLSIKRNDREPCKDWRHFQQIKNQLAGDECEALELYPAESRLVDSANQYWLWVFPPGTQLPVGFTERYVDDTNAEAVGAKQRKFSA